MMADFETASRGPLDDLDEWEDDLRRRYPEPADRRLPSGGKKANEFRDYRTDAKPHVKEFYRQHHR
ncbi:MAG: hypothetical protein ACREHD_17635, partial [Pirellulales bacterium]